MIVKDDDFSAESPFLIIVVLRLDERSTFSEKKTSMICIYDDIGPNRAPVGIQTSSDSEKSVHVLSHSRIFLQQMGINWRTQRIIN